MPAKCSKTPLICAHCGERIERIPSQVSKGLNYCSRECHYANPKSAPIGERFWSKVDKSGDCWLWTGYLRPDGYGEFRVGGRAGRGERAHRVAYELTYGPIPDGQFVCHHCDNRRCVRQAHLFLGTHTDNMRDMINKGRWRPPQVPQRQRAKFSDEQAANIRAAVIAGPHGTARALARQYGVSDACISRIRLGKVYR